MTTSKEALTLFNEVGDRSGSAEAYVTLARLHVVGGQAARARTLAAEGVAAAEDIGSPTLLGNALIGRAEVELAEGAVAAAEGSLRQALQLMHQAGDRGGVADCLDSLAQAAGARRRWKRAATLLGAAAAARKAVNVAISTVTRANVERLTDTVRAALGESVFGRTYEAAGKMEEHEMVSYALAESAQAQAPTAAREDTEDLLTDRERQVAVLVARGSSNRDIAATLFISERTVESHIQHILNKLSFRSRAQIAAWAVVNRLQ
jgi:non-specific serine/threonine protein kinase